MPLLRHPVTDVASLLIWLGRRTLGVAPLFEPELVLITLNEQSIETFTNLHDGARSNLTRS